MKIHLMMTVAIFSRVLAGAAASAQAPAPPVRLDTAMVRFFTGHWTGSGAFAGGGKIAAEVSFAPVLDSAWLMYEHRDRPPGRYQATSMWGVDGQTGQFVAYTFDNFHGHRQWMSSGWAGGRMVLSTGGWAGPSGMVFEHFIYERLSEDQFKMVYEVSRDGIGWKLGDWLVFTRS